MSASYDEGVDGFGRHTWDHWDLHHRISMELAELVRVAQEYDLPLPVEPYRMCRGRQILPALGPNLARWIPADPRQARWIPAP
jgi:hypothetical protein